MAMSSVAPALMDEVGAFGIMSRSLWYHRYRTHRPRVPERVCPRTCEPQRVRGCSWYHGVTCGRAQKQEDGHSNKDSTGASASRLIALVHGAYLFGACAASAALTRLWTSLASPTTQSCVTWRRCAQSRRGIAGDPGDAAHDGQAISLMPR
jgi:hypothetical protein